MQQKSLNRLDLNWIFKTVWCLPERFELYRNISGVTLIKQGLLVYQYTTIQLQHNSESFGQDKDHFNLGHLIKFVKSFQELFSKFNMKKSLKIYHDRNELLIFLILDHKIYFITLNNGSVVDLVIKLTR